MSRPRPERIAPVAVAYRIVKGLLLCPEATKITILRDVEY